MTEEGLVKHSHKVLLAQIVFTFVLKLYWIYELVLRALEFSGSNKHIRQFKRYVRIFFVHDAVITVKPDLEVIAYPGVL
jgi:hypothetical protein